MSNVLQEFAIPRVTSLGRLQLDAQNSQSSGKQTQVPTTLGRHRADCGGLVFQSVQSRFCCMQLWRVAFDSSVAARRWFRWSRPRWTDVGLRNWNPEEYGLRLTTSHSGLAEKGGFQGSSGYQSGVIFKLQPPNRLPERCETRPELAAAVLLSFCKTRLVQSLVPCCTRSP